MVCEQQTIMRLDVLSHCCRQLGCRRRAVLRDGNAAERRDDLGEHGAIERNSRYGKAGGDRRMRMHDCPHVRAVLVHLEVHEQL